MPSAPNSFSTIMPSAPNTTNRLCISHNFSCVLKRSPSRNEVPLLILHTGLSFTSFHCHVLTYLPCDTHITSQPHAYTIVHLQWSISALYAMRKNRPFVSPHLWLGLAKTIHTYVYTVYIRYLKQGWFPCLKYQGWFPCLKHQGWSPCLEYQGWFPCLKYQGWFPCLKYQGWFPCLKHQGWFPCLKYQGWSPCGCKHTAIYNVNIRF